MKHDVTTLNTKKALAASLKKIVAGKPFSKVTVSEIVEDCGVNRKTFYYHFEDVYALLKWTLEQEAIDVVKQFDLVAEYEEVICFVMDYVEQNQRFLLNVYNSLGRDELKRFFYTDFADVARYFIEEGERMMRLTVPEDYKHFLEQFYAEALAGILQDWIVSREKRDREKTIQYISMAMRSTLPGALQMAASLPNESRV